MSVPLDPRSCKFTFECERQWTDLRPLHEQKGVRHCHSCNQSVYRVRSRKEWDEAVEQRRCVSVAWKRSDRADSGLEITLGVPARLFEGQQSKPGVDKGTDEA